MTMHKSTSNTTFRRVAAGALAGAAVVSGLVMGVAPAATAQPVNSASSDNETKPAPISPDQVLAMISDQYQTGRGGGQVSKLIEQVVTLRQRGIRPSMANSQALLAALDQRPNQGPLIEALQATVTYQRKVMAQGANGGMPATGAPPVATPGTPAQPAWVPGNPMQRDSDEVFQIPGR